MRLSGVGVGGGTDTLSSVCTVGTDSAASGLQLWIYNSWGTGQKIWFQMRHVPIKPSTITSLNTNIAPMGAHDSNWFWIGRCISFTK